VPFLSVGAEDLANHIDRSIQDRRPLGVAPKQGGATRILAGPLAEISASHLQGLARLAQARRHQLRQFDANRVVDSVRHGAISGVSSALCQREAKNWEVGACGAGAAGSEIQPYLEGGIEGAALSGGRRVAVGGLLEIALFAHGYVPECGGDACEVYEIDGADRR